MLERIAFAAFDTDWQHGPYANILAVCLDEIAAAPRELTLLPLNVKHMPMQDFQKEGAPRGVTLIITPYTTPLPLFSPPLIHADLALTPHQQQQIRKILES